MRREDDEETSVLDVRGKPLRIMPGKPTQPIRDCKPNPHCAPARCNCVRHAILSAPGTWAYTIVSRAMQKPSGGHVHVCARVSEHVCTEPTYTAWILTYFMIAANTQRLNISHVIHDTHLACTKMANVFRRPRAFSLLQGRFCMGADTTAYANVSGRTQLHYAAASGRTQLHTLLHRGHNCMGRPQWGLNRGARGGRRSKTPLHQSNHFSLIVCRKTVFSQTSLV